MSESAFDAGIFSARYALLDQLPDELYQPVLVNPHGELLPRTAGVLRWREALLDGRLPDEADAGWPEPALLIPLHNELQELGLARYCRQEAQLADAVLLSILNAVAGAAHDFDRSFRQISERLTEEAQARRRAEEEARLRVEAQTKPLSGKVGAILAAKSRGRATPHDGTGSGAGAAAEVDSAEPQLDADTLRLLKDEARRLASEQAAQTLTGALRRTWAERVMLWDQIAEVFGEIRSLLGLGWDLSLGVLRTQGWLEVLRLHELLKRLPALQELIRALGRMQTMQRPDEPPILTEVMEQVRRSSEELRHIPSPLVPAETRGVERSDELSRMLPMEATLLGHPVLKKLWHARRAERGLMTYRVEGVYTERVSTETEGEEQRKRLKPPTVERGPILICMDTSSSMAGLPETVAKALTLEAARVAYQERRGCYLYVFSGPGQVAEQELTLSPEGLAKLMAFLTMSFHGGTDVAEPLSRAAQRLDKEAWTRADILLVSDGEFGVPGETVAQLRSAKKDRSARVHGVLIGGGSKAAMAALCDPVHRFTSWATLSGEPTDVGGNGAKR